MNKKIQRAIALCFFCCFLILAANGGDCHAQTNSLLPVWDHYIKKISQPGKSDMLRDTWERYVARTALPVFAAYPGRKVGDDAALSSFTKISGWRHRATSYELYFVSSGELARSVYGLAIRSGDVDRTMPLDRFEKGVRGFHYSIGQVCLWVDAVLAGDFALQTDEERQLLRWLLKDGAVTIRDGKASPGGGIRHVLGAAPGKKRSFEITLRHERLHVLWDEDPLFAESYREKWRTLDEDEKQVARKKLAAYAQGNEEQLVEEWAVFQAENMPEEQRKSLVGL